MAVPKYKTSKARTRRRRSINSRIAVASLVECGTCGAKILPHRVCTKCGSYRGKQVIDPANLD
jgi:large subunit ribosomal protein L32